MYSINNKLKSFPLYACMAIPLENTTKDVPGFVKWFLQSFILSLSGFWLPFILSFLYDDMNLLEKIIYSAPFSVYTITFLSQKLVLNFTELKINKHTNAANARAIVSVMTIMIILLQVCIWTNFLMNKEPVGFLAQIFIFLITFLLAVILYGMQGSGWEDSLENELIKQNSTIESLNKNASHNYNDGEGNRI